MNELMIHVERIVRPVRAGDRRKLAMRRELLAHLQAALQEERSLQGHEAKALDAAKRRLGDPVPLTRALQASVPWLERTLLARLPAPRWMNAWELKMGRQMGMENLTIGQASLYYFGSVVLTFFAVGTLGCIVTSRHREQMMQALAAQSARFLLGHLLSTGILMVIMGFCFHIVGEVARAARPMRGIAKAGACVFALSMAWTAVVTGIVAQQPIQLLELGMSFLVSAALVFGLAIVGHLTARMGLGHDEWLALKIDA